jgi:hypothetical protein
LLNPKQKTVMKKSYSFCVILFLFLGYSCHKETDKPKKPSGRLAIEIGLFVSVNEVDGQLKSTLGAENFKVIIFNSSSETILEYARASEMPDEIELEAGEYYVVVHSDNNTPAAFENPFYYGESGLFSINPNEQKSVVVNCELANTMVSIVYSDNVKNTFSNYITTVSSSSGTLVYSKEETRAGYFQPLPLNISATLTWEKTDGSFESKTLTGAIPDPQPKKHYEIHINASADGSSALIQINLDESPGQVEVVDITDEIPVPGNIGRGELLITEIMYDPVSLTDANGEWFEIYNNTNRSISLQNLVIKKDDDSHIINEAITLNSHSYYVLARTDQAVSVDNYVYGTGISLTNSGAVLSINNYGSDGTDGSVICSVNYGAEDFPAATGASLNLDPDRLNQADAESGTSWCVAASVYNTGDLGTPGIENDNCN